MAYLFRINVQQIKFDNVFRTSNTTSKVRVSYLDLKFRGFKIKKHGTCDVLKDKKQQRRRKQRI